MSGRSICHTLLTAAFLISIAATDQPLGPTPSDQTHHCGLNGDFIPSTEQCQCDPGWRGDTCSILDLQPASPKAYGLDDLDLRTPTWGGGAVFEQGSWHLIVGARDIASSNNTITDYPCDSKIVHAVSTGSDPAGPYFIVETLYPRSSWEPGLARGPHGELLLMFFGNISDPPPVGSPECLANSVDLSADAYNLTTMGTYIAISKSGSVFGPWTKPLIVKGMENKARPGLGPYHWRCASGNPSPAWHPNGTLFAAMRHNPCWKGYTTREHIGLWRADDGWDGVWVPVGEEPLFGWGNGSQQECTDKLDCPSLEDPHLWWDERGAHLLMHAQNNVHIHQTRGGYGWAQDGIRWTLETVPLSSNISAWLMEVRWTNGSISYPARRQRPSFIRDVDTNKITHLINGADFNHHSVPGDPHFCEGCHWGTGITLIQPVAKKQNP